ncbi:MAG: Serine/threonine-protein kinase PknK [Anaerolineales bacterium]|nr:Serine/threonine-protein kinase PknK [Anaerolineales bacterium]
MTELITTKIVPPRRRPDLLDRPRLLDTLRENAHRRLVVVSAPAGYGKTSLLADFAHQLDSPVCWYTVTEPDENLWAFARYIVGAIRQQYPDFGARSLRHIDRETEDRDALVTTLVNEIHALGRPFWLIVDDFHVVEQAQDVHDFLASLIPLLPDNCHMVIATRTVPDLGPEMVARLVARREIIGLGRDALRFTPEEVQAFLRDAYDYEISLDQARELAEVSEGWITAIILTSQAGDPLAGIARARDAGERLYEYLATEVLARLSPDTRNFLLDSSVLREMAPEVVNALLDMDDAGLVLELLEHQNIFVSRLEGRERHRYAGDEPQVWYRYHSLFREFLLTWLRETNPQRYWSLQQQAGYVMVEAGHWGQAIDYFLEAGAYEQAAHAIEEQAHREFTTSLADRLSRWIDALPAEVLERHPRLLRCRARSATERDNDPARALQLCELAETILRRRNDAVELAWVVVEKAVALRIQGQLQAVIDHCEEALELAPDDEWSVIAEAQRNRGLAEVRLGQPEEGVTALRTSLDLWQQVGNRTSCAVLHNDLGHALYQLGNLTASELHYRKALEIWNALDDPGRAVLVLNNIALVYHDRGSYTESLKEYRRALERARDSGSRRYRAYALIGMGDVYRDLGRYTDAVETYKQGLLDARKAGDAYLGAYCLDALGQTYHLMGETSDGIALIRRAYEDAQERGAAHEVALYQLSLGAIAHTQGFLDEARSRLKHCITHFQQGHLAELAKAYLHLAQTSHLAYRPQEMRESIRNAELCLFRLAYDGFVLATLLRTAGAIQASADTSPYLRDLLGQAEERLGPAPELALRSPQPALRVRMLGQPRVYRGDAPLENDDWSRLRAQELFFYLLTNPRRTAQQIGADLWPDLSPSKVKNNFYVTVSRVRGALGDPECVVCEDGRYAIRAPQLWVDVHQFREAIDLARTSPTEQVEARQLERAVSLYQGDFLQDFPAESDQSWVREEREALRRAYEGALDRLIEYWTARGDEQRRHQYAQLRSKMVEVPEMSTD